MRGDFVPLFRGLSNQVRVFFSDPTQKKACSLRLRFLQDSQKFQEVVLHARRENIPLCDLWSRGHVEDVKPVFNIDGDYALHGRFFSGRNSTQGFRGADRGWCVKVDPAAVRWSDATFAWV